MNQPIGVFDSGIGGLTVLRALCEAFPYEDFIYLGDTARLPYGGKSPSTIRKYTEQAMEFFLKNKVKAVVIACNSASTQFPEHDYKNFRVYNVIDPGALRAIATSQVNRIGIIGTRATIQSASYKKKILELDPKAQVFSIACPLFVPLAEEGWFDDPVTNLIAFRYLQFFKDKDIDALVLGCTHYPLFKNCIGKIMGPTVALIDSSQTIVEMLQKDFYTNNLKANTRSATDKENKEFGRIEIMTTDNAPVFSHLAATILGLEDNPRIKIVDISSNQDTSLAAEVSKPDAS